MKYVVTTIISLFIVIFCVFPGSAVAASERELTIEAFLEQAAQNDTEFEKILINQLTLAYKKDLVLPARDLVLSVAGNYEFYLDQDRDEPEASIGLSKLFPMSGTDISAEYKTTASFGSLDNASSFTFEVSQPIAQNAFGKATRLHDKIVGLEIDIAEYQIIEAYEEYMATLITYYYSWYEAYENLKVGESSYQENVKLLDNIKERQKSKIALPIDVNKITLQVLAKKEKLVNLREEYASALNFVMAALRYTGNEDLVPARPDLYSEPPKIFDEELNCFKTASRTCAILHLLEEKSKLQLDKDVNDLLPSIDLIAGYAIDGDGIRLESDDSMAYAGVSMEWPFSDQVDRAEKETAAITYEKKKLTTDATEYSLWTTLKNLYLAMEREKELVAIAEGKIELARSVLTDETENYTYGKVTLNDYITAVNVLDANRFNAVSHEVTYKKLLVEWMRLTDKIVDKKILE